MRVAWPADVTWNSMPTGPGVRGRSTYGAPLGPTPGGLGWHGVDVTESLRRWHAEGASSNHGWIFLPSGSANGVELASCESPVLADRPMLRVAVVTPPADASCVRRGYDFGAGVGSACGYAEVVMLIDNATGFDPEAGWYRGARTDDASLRTATDCQSHCLTSDVGCAYFSFEIAEGNHGVQVARCQLKRAFRDAACNEYAQATPSACGGGTGNCWSGPATCAPPSLAPSPPGPPPHALPPGTRVTTATIYDIQHVAATSSGTLEANSTCAFDSARKLDYVRTRGVVTALALPHGFYMQMPPADVPIQRGQGGAATAAEAVQWTGVYVYTGGGPSTPPWVVALKLGQLVEVVGQVNEYRELTEIWKVREHSLPDGPGGALHPIAPVDVSTHDLGYGCSLTGEAYEGVLVRLSNVRIASSPSREGGITIDDGSGPAELQDDIFDTDACVPPYIALPTCSHASRACMHACLSVAWTRALPACTAPLQSLMTLRKYVHAHGSHLPSFFPRTACMHAHVCTYLRTCRYLRDRLCGSLSNRAATANRIYRNLPSHMLTSVTGVVRYAGGAYQLHPRSGDEVVLDGPAKGTLGCAQLEAAEKLVHLWHVMRNVSEGGGGGSGDFPGEAAAEDEAEPTFDEVIDALGYAPKGGGSGGLVAFVVIEHLLVLAAAAGYVYWRHLRGGGGGGWWGMHAHAVGGARSRTTPTVRRRTETGRGGASPPVLTAPPLGGIPPAATAAAGGARGYESPQVPLALTDSAADGRI